MAALVDKYTKEELEKIINQSTSMQDFLRNLGYSSNSSSTYYLVRTKLNDLNIDYSSLLKTKHIPQKRNVDNIFIKNSTADQHTLRKYYKEGNYSEYKCSICGQEPVWQGKDLTLILDHIDGDNHNSVLENLRWVCPNCNQQLPTTGFKKMRVKKIPEEFKCKTCGKIISRNSTYCLECSSSLKKEESIKEKENKGISRDFLKKEIRTKSFIQIGKEQGVSDNAIRKWCKKHNLPNKKSEIQKYTDEEWDKI